jgi:hypothetical protein
MDGEVQTNEDCARLAYALVRGQRSADDPMPHWDDLPPKARTEITDLTNAVLIVCGTDSV